MSLAHTLYNTPVTILLSGELGSGKTTFLNGFSEGLGIVENLQSPTFALEHRHTTANGLPFLHIDLYRLSGKEADAFVEQTADFEGYRCIEWAQHLSNPPSDPHIAISIEDTHRKRGHLLELSFHDFPLPSTEQILAWRKEVELPSHIAAHCDVVAELSVDIGKHLVEQGRFVRLNTLKAAGQVHDLMRFVDFASGGSPSKVSDPEPAIWKQIRNHFSGHRHEESCALFLKEHGFPALATIVAVHGLQLPPSERRTVEQQILYYADKRVNQDKVVSLEERFSDFAERYKESPLFSDGEVWFAQAKELEGELFGGKPPF